MRCVVHAVSVQVAGVVATDIRYGQFIGIAKAALNMASRSSNLQCGATYPCPTTQAMNCSTR